MKILGPICTRPCSKSDTGAVLPEFAIAVPLVLVFLVGILQVGRLLSQVTWVNQASFLAAMLGAETPRGTNYYTDPNSGISVMRARAEKIRQITGADLWAPEGQSSFQASAAYIGSDLVEVHTTANVRPLLTGRFDMSVAGKIVAPILINSSANIGNPNQFPPNQQNYGCSGGRFGGTFQAPVGEGIMGVESGLASIDNGCGTGILLVNPEV